MVYKRTNSLKETEKARKILGISKPATENKVKRIYRALVKKWHPDTNKTKKARSRIQEINNAFETIMKGEFGKIDPWRDYSAWWWKQYGSDPIWGDPSAEEHDKSNKFAGIKNNHTKLLNKKTKKDIVSKFLDKRNTFAVVGVSKNPKKYGNKVYKELKGAGYRVYPINPRVEYVEDDKCYSSLSELPIIPDVVSIVVPPKIAEKVVEESAELGIKKVWLQPGSESRRAIEFCKKGSIQIMYNMCVMIERRGLPDG